MIADFEKQYRDVEGIKNPTQRGFRFQELLRDFLTASRFDVRENPRGAKPRQSDLFASYDDVDFLIEAKWVSRKLDVSDVDDLRVRLERTPSYVIGCLLSMSDYTSHAIEAVEADRKRVILLFREEEVRECLFGRMGIVELLKLKRKELAIDGRVWFSSQKRVRATAPKIRFPPPSRSFSTSRGSVVFFPASDCLTEVVFTDSVPDVRWNVLGGTGVGLHLRLNATTLNELKGFLEVVHHQLGLTSDGTFSIRQLDASWHGFGAANLLMEARRWRERYAEAKLKRIHHSEDLHYFDECRGGLLLLTARQHVHDGPFQKDCRLHGCAVKIHLPGVPMDSRPFIRVCEAAGEVDPFFVPLAGVEVDSVLVHDRIYLEPVQKIVGSGLDGERFVCGLVAKNPFTNSKLILNRKLEHSALRHLGSTDQLVCNLSDWHGVGDVADQYYVRRLSGINVGGVMVFEVSCTWESIVKRRLQPEKQMSWRERLKETELLAEKYGAKIVGRKRCSD